MKTIATNVVLEGIRSRKDRSLGLTFSTPELTTMERSIIMDLQGMSLDMTIRPLDEPVTETLTVDKDVNTKTPSQRIRAVLYILFNQDNEGMDDFEVYYRNKLEKYIEMLKGKIKEDNG